ncbi:polysaccharide biosynthesis protein [Corynebacterium sp. 3HC-13]|uniref:polysaccharide biosynthesis protein n=1 Tax=Corynebacterium poyangense TaxID=2684405 RepID=UPI001CCA35FA|nr:nucleoside-diphosphate sugar epimerase/dehydratase [Corynebacterium poyangense]MBZ8177031.1 polysaccharide biosynthesis protein [Corynebacterium poyangense]
MLLIVWGGASASVFVVIALIHIRSLPTWEMLLSTPLMAGLLMLGLTAWERSKYNDRHHPAGVKGTKVLVVGAGEAGYWLVRSLSDIHASPYQVVGLIDDDPKKLGTRLGGAVKVLGGREELGNLAKRLHVDTVLFAIHNISDEGIRDYAKTCTQHGLKMLILPSIKQMFHRELNVHRIREIKIEDLLGRRQITTDLSQISDYISQRRVLVTGAGGSIGSEICRQVHLLEPSELIMLDRDENALHAIQLDIYGQALLNTPDMVLCDIRDQEALSKIFKKHKPQVIFHAAALKHLPMLELYPEEGWKTNTLGSYNLLRLAVEYGVECFVNISTDKAADPTSTLGRTKRLAEQLTAYFAKITNKPYVSVRFGNVLGSQGSVFHTFKHQIEHGGPITVTHRDVERYFMTIPEACQLVIQAGAIGRPGEVMVLDMGEPVKIYEMAKRMIDMSKKDVEIIITGLRPGEKMSEILLSATEDADRPYHPLISHVPVIPVDAEKIYEKRTYAIAG